MSTHQTISNLSPAATKPTVRTKADWRALVEDWQASGLPVSQFCRQHQVPEHQIHYYRRKYFPSSSNPSSKSNPAGFAQVAMASSLPSNALMVRLPNGVELSGFSSQHSPQWIADMVKVLL